ncbi:hypothetical protein HZB07_01725 [Candidatus Saganbacteria bacterium]|nr:hypothetical protein [Candidatus Saganbacteria bacterium]
MSAATKLLKKEIIKRIDELPVRDIKDLRNYIIFLEMKNFIPQIDPDQAYYWTKKWQKLECEADADIKAKRLYGPYNSAKELLKQLNK